MKRHWHLFTTATRYALIEHARNRFAMLLVVLFIPTWVTLIYVSIPDTPARFRLRATGEILTPAGNQLTEITGALNAVTLIIGFMMFAATFANGGFDRRLAMAGYPRVHLLLAKIASLILASATVTLYAVVVISVFWSPRQPLLLAAGLFSAAMTYGMLGVAFGALLSREVEGMFAIVMTSVVDLGLQNPIASAGADGDLVLYLPSHGAMQASTAAGFSTTPQPGYLAVQLIWFTAAAVISLFAFHRRTRTTLRRHPEHHPESDHR